MKIRLLNDPILRKLTEAVKQEELSYVLSLIPQMVDTMKREDGFGLAANQVGVSLRFFIMKISEDKAGLFINPEILESKDVQLVNEGCLSIPGVMATNVERSNYIKIKYLDETFSEKIEEYTGLLAQAVQHEIDHLDGKLYIDKLKPLKRSLLVDRHRKYIKLRSRSGL